MMKKKVSLLVFSNTGYLKQIALSKTAVQFIGLGFMAGLIFLAWGITDYYNLKKAIISHHEYTEKNADQLDEIIRSRKHIQQFADEVNALKSRLVELDNFEKKIRIIAAIDNASDQDSFFGIGGSIPEDLNTQIPLMKRHNSLIREIHEQTPQLELASKNQVKRFESLLMYFEQQRDILSSTPTIRPTNGWVTSQFGYRISPYTGIREFHKGLDIANRQGTPIIASADGTVTSVSFNTILGKFMIIDHGHGVITKYAHIQKALKKDGEEVKRGDTIALIGNTGRSTGPHLHYEVFLNGIPVNPTKYILN
jgi:murein DD-endopeptidase MepM/ murein hydrolase activator NlpD